MFDFRAKIFFFRLQLLTLIILSGVATAQPSKEAKSLFAQAESYYLYGDYEMANPLYLTIASFDTDNNNIIYKIGNCYLNITDEKSKAIEFLEKAVKSASGDAKPTQLKEKKAPLDAYFSLARAYMINNDIEKAMNTFRVFQRMIDEAGEKAGFQNTNFIEQQLLACQNAIKFRENPVAIDTLKLPAEFSQGSVNDAPAISFDGNTIAYTERRGISNAIYYAKKENGKWLPPVEITYEINAGEDCSTCSLNSDGTVLFLYKEDMEDGNIYSSSFSDGKWGHIKKLNPNINTKYYESHASVSSDGKKLYFTSNREDGQDLDIYLSEKDASGDWGAAKMLGSEINSPFNEDTPFITKDDSVLFFCSEGYVSMGGYDIFKSTRKGDLWQTPVNMGSPINTTDDDKFFAPYNNGLNGYYSTRTDYKKREIIYLGIGVPAKDIFYTIRGTLSLNDTLQKPDESNKIYLLDIKSGDTLNIGYPVKDTGLYRFTVIPGNYRVIFTGINYLPRIVDTLLTYKYPAPDVIIDITIEKVPEPVTYDKIDLSNIPIIAKVDSADLVTDVKVVGDEVLDADVLYFTVQVMALHNPVDISYFKYISDMKVMYNDLDKFYRYTTGKFNTREEAVAHKAELRRKGYPEDIFIKKVSK
jgi:tetratricopeptide (TPR) repeat protein